MAGGRIAHATLKGPSVVKEICIGIALGPQAVYGRCITGMSRGKSDNFMTCWKRVKSVFLLENKPVLFLQ